MAVQGNVGHTALRDRLWPCGFQNHPRTAFWCCEPSRETHSKAPSPERCPGAAGTVHTQIRPPWRSNAPVACLLHGGMSCRHWKPQGLACVADQHAEEQKPPAPGGPLSVSSLNAMSHTHKGFHGRSHAEVWGGREFGGPYLTHDSSHLCRVGSRPPASDLR